MEALVIFLVVVILGLAIYAIIVIKQNNYYRMAMGNLASMAIMQRMFELMSSNVPAIKKVEELNNIIIEAYGSGYSTISLFDGTEYEIKATNVENMYIPNIQSLAETVDFKTNTTRNISKYLVSAGGRNLSYTTAAERDIKSAMFSPIYYNETFLGFWLLEDKLENAFDLISKEELAKLKDNMGVFIQSMISQDMIEKAHNTDKQTGLYNNLYLYSVARNKISVVDNSAIALMQFVNLPTLNEELGREIGNRLIEKASKTLIESMGSDLMLVRYSGSKFCIVAPSVTADAIQPMLERYLSNIKLQDEIFEGKKITLDISIVVTTIKRQSNIEKEIGKLERYVEAMKESNTIKII